MSYLFQKALTERANNLLLDEGGVVLAASCGSGKTNMAIDIIDRFMKAHPMSTVMVLAHGQHVIRRQFYERIATTSATFKVHHVKQRLVHLEKGVVYVSLPHAFIGGFVPGGIDLLVVDEAHHFYHAPMVQNIIEHYKPRFELLLTGSPSVFIKKKTFPIVVMSSVELLQSGVISDPVIEIAESAYDYRLSDYETKSQELTASYAFKKEHTESSLDGLARALSKKLSTNRVNKDVKSRWGQVTARLDKTMIACRNILQAKAVSDYFSRIGIPTISSYHLNDLHSKNVETFVSDPNVKILVVVNRGVLGFNFENLSNVIDMSGSLNPDRIFQLLSRVVRKSDTQPLKLFVKISPKELLPLTYMVMSFTVALADKGIYSTFDGKFRLSQTPVKPEFANQVRRAKRTRSRLKIPKITLPEVFTFNDIKNIKEGRLSEVAYTTFGEVATKLYSQGQASWPSGYWSLERCIEIAHDKSKIELKEDYPGAYNAIHRNDWWGHLGWSKGETKKHTGWTKEIVISEARKYRSREEWKHGSKASYSYALDKRWRGECTAHMAAPNNKNTPYRTQELIQAASRFTSTTQWNKEDRKTYRASQKKGKRFFKEVTKNMVKPDRVRSNYWTEERVRKEAKKYKTRTQWCDGSNGSYHAAKKLGIADELLPAMANGSSRIIWTKEAIKKEAQKYLNRSDWKRKSPGSYDRARRFYTVAEFMK